MGPGAESFAKDVDISMVGERAQVWPSGLGGELRREDFWELFPGCLCHQLGVVRARGEGSGGLKREECHPGAGIVTRHEGVEVCVCCDC